MCVKPNFYTTTICKDCGHRINTYHRSDALRLPFQCRKCGSQNLEYQHHNYSKFKVINILKRIFTDKTNNHKLPENRFFKKLV